MRRVLIIYCFILLCACSNNGGVSKSQTFVSSANSINVSSLSVVPLPSSSIGSSSSVTSVSSSSSQASMPSSEIPPEATNHVSALSRIIGLFNGLESKRIRDIPSTFGSPIDTIITSKIEQFKGSELLGDPFEPIKNVAINGLIGFLASFLDQISDGLLEPPAGINVSRVTLEDDVDLEQRYIISGTVIDEACELGRLCSVSVNIRLRVKVLGGRPGGTIPSGEFNVSVTYPMDIFVEAFELENESVKLEVSPSAQPVVSTGLWALTGGYEGELSELSLDSLNRLEFRARSLDIDLPLRISSKLSSENFIEISLRALSSVRFESSFSRKSEQKDYGSLITTELLFDTSNFEFEGDVSARGSHDQESIELTGALYNLSCQSDEQCEGQLSFLACSVQFECDEQFKLLLGGGAAQDNWTAAGRFEFDSRFTDSELSYEFNASRDRFGVLSVSDGKQLTNLTTNTFDLSVSKENRLLSLSATTNNTYQSFIEQSGEISSGELIGVNSEIWGRYLSEDSGVVLEYIDDSSQSFWINSP